tara:strand:+ start:24 stop:197 length:174 start_codon:yes stop_codon:yes gene_type:complete
LIKYAEQGLKLSAEINLVTNVKDAILEILKGSGEDEDELAQKSQILKMIAPIFMMQL